MRSGSLADGNQLSALQRPRALSSLQTNPVREVAAERCHGPRTQRDAHTHTQSDTHSQTHTDHGGDMGRHAGVKEIYMGEGDRRRKKKEKKEKEAGKQTQSEKNAENGTQKTQIKQKEKLKCFPGRVCEEGGGEKKK